MTSFSGFGLPKFNVKLQRILAACIHRDDRAHTGSYLGTYDLRFLSSYHYSDQNNISVMNKNMLSSVVSRGVKESSLLILC